MENDVEIENETYGDNFGPDSEYIKLVSADGHEFVIKKDRTLASRTIKESLLARKVLAEDEENVMVFETIPTHLLEKVCQYFQFRAHYTSRYFEAVPRFPIDESDMGDLLEVANILQC